MDKQKVSILIPTFNRPEYLKRLLRYYLRSDVCPNILIADSSVIPLDGELNELVNTPCLTYLKFPSELDPQKKCLQALGKVNTEYVVLCADDDFVVPSAIVEAVGYMEANPDYSVVLGLMCSHSLIELENGEVEFTWAPNQRGVSSITSDNPSERLMLHLQDYKTPTFYGVHKTSHLRYAFEETIKTTAHGRMGEIVLTALTSIYGKIGILPIYYASRERGDGVERKLASLPYFHTPWSFFLSQDSFKSEYEESVKCLSTNLQKQIEMDDDAVRRVVENALNGYLVSVRRKLNKRRRYYISSRDVLSRIADKFGFKRPVRWAYRHVNSKRGQLSGKEVHHIDQILRNDTNFKKNLNLIEESVVSFRVHVRD